MKKMINFGNLNLNALISRLFWSGNIPIAIGSYIFVKHFFPTNTADKTITNAAEKIMQQPMKEYSYTTHYITFETNPLIAIFLLIICFVTGVVIWRVICEIIFIIVRYYKNNTNPGIDE